MRKAESVSDLEPNDPDLVAMGAAITALQTYADDVFGMFHDALMGWSHCRAHLQPFVDKEVAEGMSREAALARPFSYGQGQENWRRTHQTTVGTVLDRCSPHSANEHRLAALCFVSIFAHWEKNTRPAIAAACKVKHVRHDLFGDMCKLRNILLHAQEIAPSEVSRFRALRWFKPGDRLVIDREKLLEVVDYIRLDFPDGLTCGDDVGMERVEKFRDIEWPPPGGVSFSKLLQDSIAKGLRERGEHGTIPPIY